MTRSLKPALLALLISPVTSLRPLEAQVTQAGIVSPTCSLVSIPSTAPANNIPSWCACESPNNGGPYATTSPPAIASPSGNQLCSYDVVPSSTISPTPVTCKLASATTGFTIPHSWCDCVAGTDTATYSTIYGSTAATGINGACSFMQEDFYPAATISPSAATCIPESANPGFQFYDHLLWCACGDNELYPLVPNPLDNNLFNANPKAPAYDAQCTQTTQPSSTITVAPISSTLCLAQWVGGTTTVCECSEVIIGAGNIDPSSSWVIQYPTNSDSNCVFTTVPTATYAPP